MKASRYMMAAAILSLESATAFAGFPSAEVFLPAVGRVAGQGGAQFFTTIWVTNLTGAPESFTLQFLKGGQANPAPETFPDTLQPGETKTYENVVESVFQQTNALGAARIVSSGEIFVAERIFNQAPGTDLGETEGLFFAGVPKEFSISLGQSASIQGINQGGSENFRYNFALVETGNGSPTVNVQVFDGSGALLGEKAFTLQPFEQIQPNVADVVPGFSSVNARITATVTAGSGSVLIAGAQVANVSQDSSGFEMSFRGDLLGGQDGSGTAGVISLNGLSGILNLTPGNGISITPSITPSGSSIQVAFTGGGSSGITSVVHDGTLAGDGTAGTPLGVAIPLSISASINDNMLTVTNTSTDSLGGAAFFESVSNTAMQAASTDGDGVSGLSLNQFGVSGVSNKKVGVFGQVRSTTDDTGGVIGDTDFNVFFNITGEPSAGVRGKAASHVGVLGVAQSGIGVRGVVTLGKSAVVGQNQSSSNDSSGVFGIDGTGSTAGIPNVLSSGVRGESATHFGVVGLSGSSRGVFGRTKSNSDDAAGVFGTDGGGETLVSTAPSAGLRGESVTHVGVLGVTRTGSGVTGVLGTTGVQGELGAVRNSKNWALFATGNANITGGLTVAGTKSFAEPHPTDPGKEIRFVCLEGPESGTYFRGHGRFNGGVAAIEVPESFRLVTDEEGLTVVATAVGAPAVIWVAKLGLDRIVLQASSDVEFHYVVNGVRRAYKDFQVVRENELFVPDGPDDRRFATYPAEIQRRLVATGIYNADGTVNLETAKRLGWDKKWDTRADQERTER